VPIGDTPLYPALSAVQAAHPAVRIIALYCIDIAKTSKKSAAFSVLLIDKRRD
jgi:hypothetical protein